MIRGIWLSLSGLILLGLFSTAQAFRPEGQAVTYADFQYVNYIATSMAKVYFATTDGIIVFNKLQNQWETPMTGIEGIPDVDVKQIWVDRFDQKLFAQTITGTFSFDFAFQRWSQTSQTPVVSSDDKHVKAPTAMCPPFGDNYNGSGILIDPNARSYPFSTPDRGNRGSSFVSPLVAPPTAKS